MDLAKELEESCNPESDKCNIENITSLLEKVLDSTPEDINIYMEFILPADHLYLIWNKLSFEQRWNYWTLIMKIVHKVKEEDLHDYAKDLMISFLKKYIITILIIILSYVNKIQKKR
jgi:hypothetical protein